MTRSLLVLIAGLALALGWSTPASAATADTHASCAGLVGPFYAGQGPGTHADVTLGVVAEFRSEGMPPGANFHDFASFHDGSAEACLA
jgi:hypothetical protein